jgi:hypothetical protein
VKSACPCVMYVVTVDKLCAIWVANVFDSAAES